ncbi:MAG TPA: thymidine kinase [Candidatus Faecimonas gallistercoris]|nr:thymidine kinase [Candidatus Faecimonas gallistercoris]
MAKFHFRYGAMNAGKSTILLQTAYNYEENGKRVVLLKSSIDTKGDEKIVSRIGLERKVDYLIGEDDSIISILGDNIISIDCILVDEAQFLKRKQVDELFYITKKYNIPVIAFGIRTDFKTNGFEGSIRLLELADELLEMPTICKCGKKARFNGRKVDGKFILEGDSIVIDNDSAVSYESLCGECYINKLEKL